MVATIERRKAFRAGHYLQLRISGDARTYRTLEDLRSPPQARSAEIMERIQPGDSVVFLARGPIIWQLQEGGDTLRNFSDQVRSYRQFWVREIKGSSTLLAFSVPIIAIWIVVDARRRKRREMLAQTSAPR